ncbi:MAG: TetR/AcrR family transcriptional regulator [Opitutales bacterium]
MNKQKILDVAEDYIRRGGYSSFTLADIAERLKLSSETMMKSIGSKEALVGIVAQRYADRFFEALGDVDGFRKRTAKEAIQHYCSAYHMAYTASGMACLCGVLASEAHVLDTNTRSIISRFVALNVRWLETALSFDGSCLNPVDAHQRAMMIYCSMEGAMRVATLKKSEDWILEVADVVMP